MRLPELFENKNRVPIDDHSSKQKRDEAGFQFNDNRHQTNRIIQLQKIANDFNTPTTSDKVVQRVLNKVSGDPLSTTYNYTLNRHRKLFKTSHNYAAVLAMIQDATFYNMTIKEAYHSLKKASSGSKPQSASSVMSSPLDVEDLGSGVNRYSYATKGGARYEEEEDVSNPKKRKRKSTSENITLQDKARNNAGIDKDRRLTKVFYPKPKNYYKYKSNPPVPYAAAHRTPSFFDARAGMNQGEEYRNSDEVSEAHNKRHSKAEAAIRKKLKKRKAGGEDISGLSYQVETEHEIMEDPTAFAAIVKKNLKLPRSEERLEKFYKKRKRLDASASHIAKDTRTLFDKDGDLISQHDIGPDYEMDLPLKLLSEEARHIEDYRRGQYHGAPVDYVIESDGEDSELDQDAPLAGSRLSDARPGNKQELENIIARLRYDLKKKRLTKEGMDALKELQDAYDLL